MISHFEVTTLISIVAFLAGIVFGLYINSDKRR
jgi:hypothetical protein